VAHLRIAVFGAVVAITLGVHGLVRADAFKVPSNSDVKVQFAKDDTKLVPIQKGAQIYFDNSYDTFIDFPAEMAGLTFTSRKDWDPTSVTLDIPAHTTLYLILGHGGRATPARQAAESSGWTMIGDVAYFQENHNSNLTAYRQRFDVAKRISVLGTGENGAIIVGRNLVLINPAGPPTTQPVPATNPSPTVEAQPPSRSPAAAPPRIYLPGSAPTTQISRAQSSIQVLYIRIGDSGEAVGAASSLILTATPGKPENDLVPIAFTSSASSQMYTVLDDVSRAISVHSHLGGAERLDLSFEDRNNATDDQSIGAAIGTLMLSIIHNVDIDPNFAITGDVTADAKVRKVGGVAAKLRAAAKSGCTIVAVPAEDLDQVRDAMIYDGPGIITNVQVIGISTLDDAMAVARTNRDDKLAKAISLFERIQNAIRQSPQYLLGHEAPQRLAEVLELEPNHESAALLLAYTQHKLPHLSAGASVYYTSSAVREFWNLPTVTNAPITDYSAEAALSTLFKLRPLADPNVRPYIDAWSDYIRTYREARHGEPVTQQYANDEYQQILNEGAKLNTSQDLAEKMLHEGI
jgi:hypothetical protein